MTLSVAAILAGFALLVWGADRFVTGAAAIACNLGVSSLIIGLTIVGFGTSAPEILVSAVASWNGNPGLAIGNALGSNIANIGLILGVTALIAPIQVQSLLLKRELPTLLVAMLVALALMWDGVLGRLDGLVLLMGLVLMLVWLVHLGLKSRNDLLVFELDAEVPGHMPMAKALGWFLLGLLVLLVSSRMLVWGAVNIAHALGVSDVVIGLTIVALGTSLPELAASVMSILKKEHDLAIGNVVGSNMFNMLAVLGMPGIIRPGAFPAEILSRDFPVMIGLAVLLFIMAYGLRGPGHINRCEGATLLSVYLGYMALLYFETKLPV